MNAASNSPLSAVLDAVAMEIIAQMTSEMKQQLADKDQQLLRVQQALALSEMKIQYLKEMLRLEMIKKYGMRSEKLSDL
jgi:membrane carboxypeptidase/penicillin-binding protein